jgi:hypothetical protein
MMVVLEDAAAATARSRHRNLMSRSSRMGLITDGPYLETKEHVGDFGILETADMDQAVAWARKAVIACRTPVEVREFLFQPAPQEATERR